MKAKVATGGSSGKASGFSKFSFRPQLPGEPDKEYARMKAAAAARHARTGGRASAIKGMLKNC